MLIYEVEGDLESLDHLTPALWDAGCQGLEEGGSDDQPVLRAYFPEPVELPFGGRWLEIDDTDWLARFRATITPITIDRVTISPSWWEKTPPSLRDTPPTSQGRREPLHLTLDPGMAFGTGHHETTRLAIRALQKHDLEHKDVLDVGAGSGILGIVAAKLGARVLGVDNDASTVPVAIENAQANGVGIEFVAGVLEDVTVRGPFDLLVANLFAELHDVLMNQYRTALKPGGTLIMTGILAGAGQADAGEAVTWDTSSGRENLVRDAITRAGFEFTRREQEGEWVLLEARKS